MEYMESMNFYCIPEKYLIEEQEIFSRWTEYCSKLYNKETYGDYAVLDCSQPRDVGWLVGFGFNGPLRFSLYRAVSQREREKEERKDSCE